MKRGCLLIDAAAPASLILAAQSVASRAGVTALIEEVDFADGVFASLERGNEQRLLAAHPKGIELIDGGSRRLLPYFVAPELLLPLLSASATLRIGMAPGAASIDGIGRLKRIVAMLREERSCTVTAIGDVPAPLLRLLSADECFSELTPAELVRLMAALPLFVEPAFGDEPPSHEAVLADVSGALVLVTPDSPLLPLGRRLSVAGEGSGLDLDLLPGGSGSVDRAGSRMEDAWSRIEPWLIGDDA
jgi:hypothetical protein